jgi:hypothetical protein
MGLDKRGSMNNVCDIYFTGTEAIKLVMQRYKFLGTIKT